MTAAVKSAKALARWGFRLTQIPVGGKNPWRERWPELATSDLDLIELWEVHWTGFNWGVLTGRDGGVVVVDIDSDDGNADLAMLEAENEPLPPTWMTNSGGGGSKRHLWFRPPDGTDDLKNQNSSKCELTDGRIMRFDIRGYHGQAVIPGSLHKSGRRYAWADGQSPDDIDIAECPAWLWKLLPKRGAEVQSKGTRQPRGTGTPRATGERKHDNSTRIGDEGGGFNVPIRKRCCGFWNAVWRDAEQALGRAPEKIKPVLLGKDPTQFKEALRGAILRADASKHAPDEIERYASDSYLDTEISSARKFILDSKDKTARK